MTEMSDLCYLRKPRLTGAITYTHLITGTGSSKPIAVHLPCPWIKVGLEPIKHGAGPVRPV